MEAATGDLHVGKCMSEVQGHDVAGCVVDPDKFDLVPISDAQGRSYDVYEAHEGEQRFPRPVHGLARPG